ncbi:hypothetical protein BGP_1411 [Beggiatoa sp. PS]|nr:hypothetical protein BGP_1411 [Beggiatoa sp. PS]
MKVRFDDIEFDPTCQLIQYTASYKGQPFTGTAYEIEDNCYYEWNYKMVMLRDVGMA